MVYKHLDIFISIRKMYTVHKNLLTEDYVLLNVCLNNKRVLWKYTKLPFCLRASNEDAFFLLIGVHLGK